MLINARSRRGRNLFRDAVVAVRAAGVPLAEARSVRGQDETERILREEIASGAHTVIIGGGDGTLSACADILVGTSLAMGVLPLGTGNTFARSIGIPLDLAGAARTIAEGEIEAVDVGKVNNQIFLNSVSLGLSAEIAGALTPGLKRRLGLLAWPVVTTRVLWTHRPHILKIVSPDKTFHVRTHQLLVVNGRYVAGPITAAPEASVDDDHLDVFVLGGAKHGDLARTAWRWIRGRHTIAPESRYFMTQSLRVESIRGPLPANVDGEINERTPLDIRILPDALRVVVPRGFDPTNV